MNNITPAFNGSVPQNYEDYLGSFLFQPFAEDLAERVELEKFTNILELACGTGRLTKVLTDRLSANAVLTASDLNEDMMMIAQKLNPSDRISWNTVDMASIPWPEHTFDLVLSQFGVMLVPEKLKALSEIYKVLRKEGHLVFSVWGNIADNDVWKISAEVVNSFFEIDIWNLSSGPFSMSNKHDVFGQLEQAGFKSCNAVEVNLSGVINDAETAAKGFLYGLPVAMMIRQQKPELLQDIEIALCKEMKSKLGDSPLTSRLQALIFTAIK